MRGKSSERRATSGEVRGKSNERRATSGEVRGKSNERRAMSGLPLPPRKGDNTPCTPASGGQEARGKKSSSGHL